MKVWGRRIAGLSLALTLLCGFAAAQAITGVVTNKTTGKPSGGDDVVLLKLAQGMQELARTKSDGKGKFSIDVPESGLHLLRVTHDKANYFQPVQPGQSSVNVDVFSAAPQVDGVTLDADVMRIQTDPSGSGLRVVEHFFMKNESSPAKTLMSEHPFELYLPPGATVEGAAAKAPGGMAVQSGLVPEAEANRYTIIFPIRPGETEFQVTYKVPYSAKDGFTFQPKPVLPIDTIAVMMPKAMTFKAGQSTPYSAVTEELGAQTYVARGVQPSQPLSFTVSGSGELPRDTAAGTGATGAAGTPANGDANAGGNADPNTDTRPGGGLGVPLDKDAERAPLTKYKWWILGGVGLAMAIAAGVLLRAPSSGVARVAANHTPAPAGGGALQALRDEMFALETDRLAGTLSDARYAELKGAYDVVLRRAMERNGTATNAQQAVTE